jgi:hypothetical protein
VRFAVGVTMTTARTLRKPLASSNSG